MTLGGGGLIGVIVLVAFLLLSGGGGGVGDLGALAGQTVGPGTASTDLQTECRTGADANERDDCRIVAVVNSVQAYWAKTVRNYEPARTRFFTDSIQTGCGAATSASGPFYCPRDRYIYIDLGFFEDLQSQLGARGGPLAEAYVLAHEYGHHVQNLTGALRSANRDTGPQGGQVRLELQADCYAGSGSATPSTPASSRTSPARTWRTRSTPPRRSATTGSRGEPEGRCGRSRGRTARPSSGRRGSSAASRALGPGAATRSAAASERAGASTSYDEAAMSVNFAYRFRKLSLTESVGPLRCFARITSARPCESDSSPL